MFTAKEFENLIPQIRETLEIRETIHKESFDEKKIQLYNETGCKWRFFLHKNTNGIDKIIGLTKTELDIIANTADTVLNYCSVNIQDLIRM